MILGGMDNKCENGAPLRVPGFGAIPLEEELPLSERFAHGIRDWKQVPAITRREFAMVAVMNKITDQPNWENDILDHRKVDGWGEQFRKSHPLMSQEAWNWCLAELRDKAAFFQEHDFVRVLDTGSCICKSDSELLRKLASPLQSTLNPILESRASRAGDTQTHIYIDPSRCPLVYGKTLICSQDNLKIEAKSRDQLTSKLTTSPAPEQTDKRAHSARVQARMSDERAASMIYPSSYIMGALPFKERPAYFWSYKYQWLPCEVEFVEMSKTNVKLTSPVSDLSSMNTSAYRLLEDLISLSIEPWNHCLIKGNADWEKDIVETRRGFGPPDNQWKQRGRVPCRIITYGAEFENEVSEWYRYFDPSRKANLSNRRRHLAILEDLKNKKPSERADKETRIEHEKEVERWQTSLRWLNMEGIEDLPEPTPEQWVEAEQYLRRPEDDTGSPIVLPEDWKQKAGFMLKSKVRKIQRSKHPEPGTAFSYDEWFSGRHGGKAVIDMVTDRPIDPAATPPTTPHKPYTIKLQDTFNDKRLQVIIRADGVELTPDSPKYDGGPWQMEGRKNEHIVAVSIFAYDVHNITPAHLSFRQEIESPDSFYHAGFDLYRDASASYSEGPASASTKGDQVEAVCEIFGWNPEQMYVDSSSGYTLPMQEIGKVVLEEGRLITFPNVMEYRREPFELKDPTKSGHCRTIVLMLVDPHYRICSTRNVVQPVEGDQRRRSPYGNAETDDRNETNVTQKFKEEIALEHAWMMHNRYRAMGWLTLA